MIVRTRYLLLAYSAVTAMLLSVVLLNQRDCQDSWILQDILVPTIVYVFTFAIVAVKTDDNRILTLLCASFVIVLNLIPNLKYQWFYGANDSVAHYGYIKSLLSLGFVPQVGFYAPTYSAFPGMQISVSSISLVLGIDPNLSIKLLTSIIFGIFPLMTYFVTNPFFAKDAQKYIILVSSALPVMSYLLTGTTFALVFFCLFFYMLFRILLSGEQKKEYFLVLVLLGLGIFISHAVTSLFTLILLSAMVLLVRVTRFRKGNSFSSFERKSTWILVFFSIWFVAWLMFNSNFVLDLFVNTLRNLFIGEHAVAVIPTRFYQISLFEELRVLAVYYTEDVIIALAIFGGLLVLLKRFRSKNDDLFKNLYLPVTCLLSSILLVVVFQFLTNFGDIEYRRFISYAVILSPFFSGLTFWHIDQKLRMSKLSRLRVPIAASILFICISLSLIQIFAYQPLIPTANVLSKELPANEYILDLRSVNTVYQRNMILFADSYSANDANVTSDFVTRWQIQGFGSASLSNKDMYFTIFELQSALAQNVNLTSTKWSLALLHYDGKSGPLSEKVENRTGAAIDELKDTLGNVIYDNGESFIISRFGD